MLQKENQQVLNLQVTEGLTVAVVQDSSFEFLMSTKDVAIGYGVAEASIRSHKGLHRDELTENVHFVMGLLTSVEKTNARTDACVGKTNLGSNPPNKHILWTKAGVVRLGFFIKSDRAKLFRDWAEKIILKVSAPAIELPMAKRKRHNRLTQERLLEIMANVAMIDDKALRLKIIGLLIPNYEGEINLPQKGGVIC